MTELTLRVINLRGGYAKKEVVHGVTFEAAPGDVLCILGPNGCGKSTLLKLLMGFLPRMSGEVYCRDEELGQMSRKQLARFFSYIPQSDNMVFPYTALEMVMMARTSHLSPLASPGKSDEALAQECLDRFKIGDLADSFYNMLSGGQRQLVLIARALCQNTCVMVMDEPTANLDFANQKLVTDAIRLVASTGRIVLITTHSPSLPFELDGKALLMDGGNIVAMGSPRDVLTSERLEGVYGLPMDVVSVTDRFNRQRYICLSV